MAGMPKKNGKSGTHCWGREGSTQFAPQLESAMTAPPLVGLCRLEPTGGHHVGPPTVKSQTVSNVAGVDGGA